VNPFVLGRGPARVTLSKRVPGTLHQLVRELSYNSVSAAGICCVLKAIGRGNSTYMGGKAGGLRGVKLSSFFIVINRKGENGMVRLENRSLGKKVSHWRQDHRLVKGGTWSLRLWVGKDSRGKGQRGGNWFSAMPEDGWKHTGKTDVCDT